MKKTLIALMALAGVAAAAESTMTAPENLYAGAFTFSFELPAELTVSGDYDILAAYYQVNNGNGYTVNAFKLSNTGALTLDRGNSLTAGALTNDSTLTTQDASIFMADGAAYTLTTPGVYTVSYLGGTNGEAAANLLLDGAVVASFSAGSHNMNGAQAGGLTLTLLTNDSYAPVSVPEPTTATLSLLALAGLAARRRRK